MSAAWWLGLLLAILRLSVPYVTAALGGTLCERAGVINIALEGFLLIAALGTALGRPMARWLPSPVAWLPASPLPRCTR